jgi:hypothetical protein
MNDFYNQYQIALETRLSPKDEIAFLMEKARSPFKDDSGVDYDYRGFYKKYGNLTPQATNGHLTDEFKYPNHPTFSIESKYYNGQPNAIDWSKEPYKTMARIGVI